MKAVILAGGLGSRLSEETTTRPKPMVEIGGLPILIHIMKYYFSYGVDEFIICCGYKGYFIKEYFSNYFLHNSDVTFDMKRNEMEVHSRRSEPWKVTLVDTGLNSMTGGRLKRVRKYVENEDFFFFTYGDGLSDVDISAQLSFHQSHRKEATILSVSPPGRFGAIKTNGNLVCDFSEKPSGDGDRINGGYFIISPKVIDYIENDQTIWEEDPLRNLVSDNKVMSFNHDGFWQPMDTLRDKNKLESLWDSGHAPWKRW